MAEPPSTPPQQRAGGESTPPGWQPPTGWQPPAGPPRWPEGGPYDPIPPQPGRPGQVTGAAVVLIVLGVLISLLGLLFLIFAVLFSNIVDTAEFRNEFGEVSAAAGGIVAVFGFLFLADGVLQVISGIFVLPGRSWARISGLIAGILGALIALVGVLPGQSGAGVNVFFLIVLVGYVYVVWVLATNGDWFNRRSWAGR